MRWDRAVEVEVTTLDDLIAVHGAPAFCKIDVEGFEVDVLAGLTQTPARAVLRVSAAGARRRPRRAGLVERLGAAAGGYLYNYSPIETMRFASERWLDAAELGAAARAFPPSWAAPATSTPHPSTTGTRLSDYCQPRLHARAHTCGRKHSCSQLGRAYGPKAVRKRSRKASIRQTGACGPGFRPSCQPQSESGPGRPGRGRRS